MKKANSVYDATKEELILYFFAPEFNGAGHLRADQDRFINWVNRRRNEHLLKVQGKVIEDSQTAFKEYIRLLREAGDEKDIDKKIALYDEASKAFELYEKYNKEYDKLDDQIMTNMGCKS